MVQVRHVPIFKYPINTKLVPSCTAVVINLVTRWLIYLWAGLVASTQDFITSRWEVIGMDACRCCSAVEWIHHISPINELTEGLFVCKVIRKKFVSFFSSPNNWCNKGSPASGEKSAGWLAASFGWCFGRGGWVCMCLFGWKENLHTVVVRGENELHHR